VITIQAQECSGNNSALSWESATPEKLSKPKTEDDAKIARFADMLTAMGTEPRLRIVQLLLTAHPEGLVVGDIQSNLEIAPSTLSHHLEKLKNERLVKVRRDKKFLWYTADTEALQDLLGFLFSECCTRTNAVHPDSIIQLCK
jgi:DNA-binding transcriptional ArsR family regulator